MALPRRIWKAGWEELLKYKERPIAVFFFVLEAVSVILDRCGKDRWNFLLTAFILSIFGLAMAMFCYCNSKRSTGTANDVESQLRGHAEGQLGDDAGRQLGVLEIVVSVVQFIASLLALLHVKDKYTAAVLVLSIPGIAVFFGFRRNRRVPELQRLSRTEERSTEEEEERTEEEGDRTEEEEDRLLSRTGEHSTKEEEEEHTRRRELYYDFMVIENGGELDYDWQKAIWGE